MGLLSGYVSYVSCMYLDVSRSRYICICHRKKDESLLSRQGCGLGGFVSAFAYMYCAVGRVVDATLLRGRSPSPPFGRGFDVRSRAWQRRGERTCGGGSGGWWQRRPDCGIDGGGGGLSETLFTPVPRISPARESGADSKFLIH